MINGLDLFSGIGGLSIALSEWVTPIAYCEIDPYARAVLLSRMLSYRIYGAPIWDDIRTLNGAMLPEVDIIVGGFPCQDISSAGTRKGLGGKKSNLVYEMLRLVKGCRPVFVFLENVPTIRTRGLAQVVSAFTEMGYDLRWTTVSASEVGAPHKRERWFCLAYNANYGDVGAFEAVPQREIAESVRAYRWPAEPKLDRMDNGISFRVDRNRCLGNAVVPEQAREAFKRLMGLS